MALIPVVGGVALASCTEVNFVMGGFVCALFGSLLTGIYFFFINLLLSLLFLFVFFF